MNKEEISRRSFLKRMAAGGVLIAASSLPALAEDNPAEFPNRGRFERLSLDFVTINIGVRKPFSVLHISDTHLTAAYSHENEKKQKLHRIRTKTFGGRQEEALRDSLAWAREHADYVLHTGDLIDWQSEANYDLVRKYFGEYPMMACIGNHEYSTDMWLSNPKEEHTEAYKDNTRSQLQQVYPFDIRFQSQEVGGVNFVAMDDVYGTVTQQQVDMFNHEVAKGLPIILCMHVPFYTENIFRASSYFWADEKTVPVLQAHVPMSGAWKSQQNDAVTRGFIESLKKEPLLRGLLVGHEHFTMQDRFSPTAVEYIVGGNFMFHAQFVIFI